MSQVHDKISDKGLDFIARHEGFVSRAYKDPVGIVTIGTGFTNSSATAKRMLGPIKLGMTITREQNDRVLQEALDQEYGPHVVKALSPTKQHHFDAATSFVFNVGPRGLTWKWAEAFKKGNIVEAARLLRSTAVTAKGKKLRGLVTRRKEEADLLQFGKYGIKEYPKTEPKETVGFRRSSVLAQFQEELKKLGYYKGSVDGLEGPLTTIAVKKFQEAHPQLKVDGILGRATQAQIERVLNMKKESAVTPVLSGIVATAVTSAATAYFMDSMDWVLIGSIGAFVVAALGALAFIGIKYKDELKVIKKGKKNA